MIDFISFITMLIWALIKLFASMALCCIAFIICMTLIGAIGEIMHAKQRDRYNVWAEIEAMERREYGNDIQTADEKNNAQ